MHLYKPGLAQCNDYFGTMFFDRVTSLKDPASKAYAQVFAPYHPWAIRKAVAAGMYALPTKAQLLNKLNEDGEFNYFDYIFHRLSNNSCIFILHLKHIY